MAVSIARRNLFESPTRLLISVGGVALALLLVLALDGVFAGAMRGVTAYIDRTPFDIVISQEGVRNLHMTSSQFPEDDLRAVESVDGVRVVDPILFTTSFLVAEDRRSLVYLIGYESDGLGGPSPGTQVPSSLGRDEIVIDERIAEEMSLSLGDTLTTLGRDFRVAGFVSGTVSITNSVAYIRREDFEAATRIRRTASYGLVRLAPGVDAHSAVFRIGRALGDDLTVQTKSQFAESERRVVGDMSTDIIRIMNLVGFLIGLTVVGLTTYTVTLAKLRDFGVLKALGASAARLVGIVFGQALLGVGLGLALAVVLALALSALLPLTGSPARIVVEPLSVGRAAIGAAVIAVLASVAPILRISVLQPADVFRR